MESHGSITGCIGQLKQGDLEATHLLWRRYFRRLVGLARKKLGGTRRQVADEEDVALSAMNSFFHGAMDGQFAQLEDRDDLWHLLGAITTHKANNHARHQEAKKRRPGNEDPATDPDQVIGPWPSPDQEAQCAEDFEGWLKLLDDDGLREVALWKLDGCTNDEIAARLDCVPRTVERKLRLIRKIWVKGPGS